MSDVLEDTMDTIDATAVPCDCSRPVDLVHLARYTLGDRTLEREVLELFCSHSASQLECLGASIGDSQKWREAAHTIKGSARGIGAWKLADLAEEAERMSDGPAAVRAGALEKVRQKLAETNNYIQTLFAPA